MSWRINTDSAELGSPRSKCIQGNPYTRKNHSAYILLLTVDNRRCGCSSHIDKDQRHRITGNSCHCISNLICAKLSRIIHHNVQSCLYTGSENNCIFLKNFLCGKFHNICDLRHYRRNNTALNLCFFYMIDIKNIL